MATRLLALVVLLTLASPTSVAAVEDQRSDGLAPRAAGPVEDYAPYQPQTRCRPKPRPGTRALAAWLVRRYDGTDLLAFSRPCRSGGASEHKDGRALDWDVDAADERQRRQVKRMLRRILATDAEGNRHARARRMGVMYVIWNDHIYASYDRFAKRDYLSPSCPSRKRCSATLRHRDHLHLSLSKRGAKGRTSWYAGRL